MTLRIKSPEKTDKISNLLDTFSGATLFGIKSTVREQVLVAQLVDSVRRIEYLNISSIRSQSASLHTPYSGSFQPLGGGAVMNKAGRTDDAYWLVYLATHFGKHKTDGWNLTEDFYGRFEQGGIWDWATASQDPSAIPRWFEDNYPHVTSIGRSRRFGNHRKYETLKPGPTGTGHALATYIEWVLGYGSHQKLITYAQSRVGQNPKDVFAFLYNDLQSVSRLGRLGKFDLLCNLSNLLIAPILADRPYIMGSTGPVDGAKLLFGNDLSVRELDNECAALATHLDVSPQVIEDALCNWQKSPEKYIYFKG